MRHRLYAVLNKVTYILPLPGVPPTATRIVEALKQTSSDLMFLPPIILEECHHNVLVPGELCKKTKDFVYARGSLPKHIGDDISTRTNILAIYGFSEVGEFPLMIPADGFPRFDWNYMLFYNFLGADYRPQSGSMYEMVLVKMFKHCEVSAAHCNISETLGISFSRPLLSSSYQSGPVES